MNSRQKTVHAFQLVGAIITIIALVILIHALQSAQSGVRKFDQSVQQQQFTQATQCYDFVSKQYFNCPGQ